MISIFLKYNKNIYKQEIKKNMKYLDEKLNDLQKLLSFIKALPLYELLLSIEKAYVENEDLISFSYEYNESKKYITSPSYLSNVRIFNNSIDVYPTDSDGIRSFLINKKGLSNITKFENNYEFSNKEFTESFKIDFENILTEFSLLEDRNERYKIYKKYFHGKMPNYKKILSLWEFGNLENIINDLNFLDIPDRFIDFKGEFNLNIYIKVLEESMDKFLFMQFFLLKKEMLADYRGMESFCLGVDFEPQRDNAFLKISGKGISYNDNDEKETYSKEIRSSNSSFEKVYTVKKVYYDGTQQLIIDRNTLFSELPVLNHLNINKEESLKFDTMIEKHLLLRNISILENDEVKNKKRI